MTLKEAEAIVTKIQKGNYEAAVALIKTFGLVKLKRKEKPVYKWIV